MKSTLSSSRIQNQSKPQNETIKTAKLARSRGDNSMKPHGWKHGGASWRRSCPPFRDVLPDWTSLRGRALGAQKSSTLHHGSGCGERSILISKATGEFQQCTFERLTDFLEYNAPSCCQAFMVMLHSVEEWRISATAELDRLHDRPAAAAGPRGAAANWWPEAEPERDGTGHRVMCWFRFVDVLINLFCLKQTHENSCRLWLSVMSQKIYCWPSTNSKQFLTWEISPQFWTELESHSFEGVDSFNL